MGDVIRLSTATTREIPADRVLEAAKDAALRDVIVVGRGNDGSYFSSSTDDIGLMLLMIERFKTSLLAMSEA